MTKQNKDCKNKNENKIKDKDKNKLRKKWKRRFIIFLLILSLIVVYFWRNIFITIDSGDRGVLWYRFFGTRLTKTYGEGLNIISPLDKMYIYTIRVQEIRQTVEVLAQSGLKVELEISTRYKLRESTLPKLHQNIGPDYQAKVVEPELITAVRQIIGDFNLEEVYARDEEALIRVMSERIKKNLEEATKFGEDEGYIIFFQTLVMRLKLPEQMQDMITQKLVEEQKFLAYKYSKQRELEEKERRIIEAEGIKEFERISQIPILKWRGIEATLELAKSPNTKIIIVGTDSKELPIILNADVAETRYENPNNAQDKNENKNDEPQNKVQTKENQK